MRLPFIVSLATGAKFMSIDKNGTAPPRSLRPSGSPLCLLRCNLKETACIGKCATHSSPTEIATCIAQCHIDGDECRDDC